MEMDLLIASSMFSASMRDLINFSDPYGRLERRMKLDPFMSPGLQKTV